jgi:hypothetical protein
VKSIFRKLSFATGLRKKDTLALTAIPQHVAEPAFLQVPDSPAPSPTSSERRIKSRTLSDSQLIVKPRELYTLVEVEVRNFAHIALD